MSDFELGLEDSFDMGFNSLSLDMFLTLKRSRSEDSLFGRLQYKEPESDKKNLLIRIEDACNMRN